MNLAVTGQSGDNWVMPLSTEKWAPRDPLFVLPIFGLGFSAFGL